jgi:hypothetical protein
MRGARSRHWRQEGAYKVLVGRPERKKPLGRMGVGGRIILKWIFRTRDGPGTVLIWLGIGRNGGLLLMRQ